MSADRFQKLMQRAAKFLQRRAHSRGELAVKLTKDADPDEIERVLDRLVELNLLNDREYAYNFAVYRLQRKGWGPLKVQHDLLRRQIRTDLIESALARVYEEFDGGALLDTYVERYSAKRGWPDDRKSIRRLISHLRGRGFSEEIIFKTLKHKIAASAWQQFESGG